MFVILEGTKGEGSCSTVPYIHSSSAAEGVFFFFAFITSETEFTLQEETVSSSQCLIYLQLLLKLSEPIRHNIN